MAEGTLFVLPFGQLFAIWALDFHAYSKIEPGTEKSIHPHRYDIKPIKKPQDFVLRLCLIGFSASNNVYCLFHSQEYKRTTSVLLFPVACHP